MVFFLCLTCWFMFVWRIGNGLCNFRIPKQLFLAYFQLTFVLFVGDYQWFSFLKIDPVHQNATKRSDQPQAKNKDEDAVPVCSTFSDQLTQLLYYAVPTPEPLMSSNPWTQCTLAGPVVQGPFVSACVCRRRSRREQSVPALEWQQMLHRDKSRRSACERS